MSTARWTENQTGIEVSVETVFCWKDENNRHSVVTYPTGRRFLVPVDELNLHFSIVTPQEVFIRGFGGVGDDRPTKQQADLTAQLKAATESTA